LAGLADASNSRVVELAPFKQRILTVAIALAAKPSLLLLDGPAVGMSEAERFQLAALLANGRNDSMSVLITAHNMVSLSEICDRILVLKAGKILDDAPSRIERKAAPFDGHLTRSR
jgi:ABC-type branched-subunit amino acid transport system ATPase component